MRVNEEYNTNLKDAVFTQPFHAFLLPSVAHFITKIESQSGMIVIHVTNLHLPDAHSYLH